MSLRTVAGRARSRDDVRPGWFGGQDRREQVMEADQMNPSSSSGWGGSARPDVSSSLSGQAAVLFAVWESIDTPMIVVDDSATVVLANPAALPDLLDAGVVIGGAAAMGSDMMAHADGRAVREQTRPLRRALAGELVREEELVLPGRAGVAPRQVAVSGYPFQDPDGRGMALSVWHDVTSRWELEERREAELDRLTRMIDTAGDYAILLLDVNGRVLTWSQSAERLNRYSEGEILGQPFEIFFTPQDRAGGTPASILREAAEHGRAVAQGQRVRGDGSRFWARGVVTALHGDDEQLTGYVKVTHDVTEEQLARNEVIVLNAELREVNRNLERRITERTAQLQRQTDELARANEELEAFSYSVSHHLRAPLRAMSGFARLLAEDYASVLDDQGRHQLERIRTSAREMGQLIEGLLTFSRIQRQRLAEDPLDMGQLARAARESIGPCTTRVAFELSELPPAHGDCQLVRQIWSNLLDNAVKFTATVESAAVRVSALQGDDGVTA
jgi:PAS domain S-box-containing protein